MIWKKRIGYGLVHRVRITNTKNFCTDVDRLCADEIFSRIYGYEGHCSIAYRQLRELYT